MATIRLQKHIADLGICSRRRAEELIAAGLVKVNGKPVSEMGIKIDPVKDKVEVKELSPVGQLAQNNKKVALTSRPEKKPVAARKNTTLPDKLYIALNKPVDYVSSATGTQGKSVLELLIPQNGRSWKEKQAWKPDHAPRVYPVGRLDKDSEGLILLTNDGELTNLLTHPRYEHEKEYEVIIDTPLSRQAKQVLETGMKLDDEFVQGIRIKREFNKGKRTIVTVILKEGKNRQIKKMFGRLGYNVLTLRRTRMGKLKLGTLPVGSWKFVSKNSIV